MLGYADQISWLDMFIVALAGTILGLLATALIHRHFIVDAALEFPTGNAAAQTLRATEAGGKTGKQLFGSMASQASTACFATPWAWCPACCARSISPA